jgi:hypothetical protein
MDLEVLLQPRRLEIEVDRETARRAGRMSATFAIVSTADAEE